MYRGFFIVRKLDDRKFQDFVEKKFRGKFSIVYFGVLT
jgi:hypothetical protein